MRTPWPSIKYLDESPIKYRDDYHLDAGGQAVEAQHVPSSETKPNTPSADEARPRLVLDTNIPRRIVEDELAATPFELFAQEGGTVHFADGTAVELLAWFHRNAGAWEKWKAARTRFDTFLDVRSPILMGGREVLAQAGLVLEAPNPLLPPAKQMEMNRLIWSKMRYVERLEDLEVAIQIPGTNNLLLMQAAGAPTQVQTVAARWGVTFDKYKAVVAAANTRFRDKTVPLDAINNSVKAIGEHIDARSTSCPPASIRMDGMMRVHALLSYRSVLHKNQYNPRKDKNDALDHALLRYLALPAAICTSDGGIGNDLRAAGAWQVAWVATPEELGDAACRKRLRELKWPAPWGPGEMLKEPH
jgi:hypothetical protein